VSVVELKMTLKCTFLYPFELTPIRVFTEMPNGMAAGQMEKRKKKECGQDCRAVVL